MVQFRAALPLQLQSDTPSSKGRGGTNVMPFATLLFCHAHLQGIQMLQAIEALKLQAGVMKEGAAKAVAAEESNIRLQLSALPTERLPQHVQRQLQDLGIHYGSSGAAGDSMAGAVEDFDLLQEAGLPGANSVDSKAAELAELAAHFSSSSDLAYVLEHIDELAAATAAAGEDDAAFSPAAALLSSSRTLAGGSADVAGNTHAHSELLQLDQEIDLQAADLHAAAATMAGHTDDQPSAMPSSSSSLDACGSRSSGGQPGLHWPGGGSGGKISVLGKLKSHRRGQVLPPSSKPLSKNTRIAPNLEVSRLGNSPFICGM